MEFKHHRYSDQERYEHCRKYRISGLSVSEYARRSIKNKLKYGLKTPLVKIGGLIKKYLFSAQKKP